MEARSLGPNAVAFLQAMGYRQDDISRYSPETELLRDMGLKGDDFWDALRVLSKNFDVDLSGVEFTQYAPREIDLRSSIWLFGLIPRIIAKAYGINNIGIRTNYTPVNLADIELIIARKKWAHARGGISAD